MDIKRAMKTPPRVAVKKALNKIRGRGEYARRTHSARRRDARLPTYDAAPGFVEGPLFRYFKAVPPRLLEPMGSALSVAAEGYLSHRFDLLGSGWVRVRHGMRCRGLEGHRYDPGPEVRADRDGRWLENRINRSNLAESVRIWSMVEGEYVPIDWHLDFKSGCRWPESTWSPDVEYGKVPGADVKT
ncbi:MAG: hypothetical protein ABIH66_10045, partial [bacterium]